MIDWYSRYSEYDLNLVKDYLKNRYEKKEVKPQINIVYDLLHQCDIHCRGCGTNAVYCEDIHLNVDKPSIKEIEKILLRIKDYADKEKRPVFLNFGGGEPFLRDDMLQILMIASAIFSIENIGVDTNGTLIDSYELLNKAAEYCGYIGISINGLRDYSTWWAGNSKIDVYERQMSLVSRLCLDETINNKIEVTSVATKKNIQELPALLDNLSMSGVKKYSVHRSIPVGRMKNISALIPSSREYFELMIELVKRANEKDIECHLHHSIESIHTSLLLGLDTYKYDRIGNPDIRSSIGIEPNGEVVFDPWCTTDEWKMLTAGNILNTNTSLIDMINSTDAVFTRVKQKINKKSKCHGCTHDCSGGSRMVAAVCELESKSVKNPNMDKIIDAMCSVDPGCPLYE